MVDIQFGATAESVRQSRKHVLFVEGKEPDNFDPSIMSNLLGDLVDVKPMGPSHYIRAAAEALHPHHESYYFLVDRDHFTQTSVERLWRNFPDPDTHNLLMWRRRELENYFIIPEYLALSQYCRCSAIEISAGIESVSSGRIHMEIVNYVIIQVREILKEKWIDCFDSPVRLNSGENALRELIARSEISSQKQKVSRVLRTSELEKRFHSAQKLFLDQSNAPQFGKGKWFELIGGKKILSQLIANPRLFEVKDRSDRKLQGAEKLKQVMKDLLSLPIERQPGDFKQLRKLLEKRVNN